MQLHATVGWSQEALLAGLNLLTPPVAGHSMARKPLEKTWVPGRCYLQSGHREQSLKDSPAPLSHVGFHGPEGPEDLPIQVEDDVGLMGLQHGGQHVQDRAPFPPA